MVATIYGFSSRIRNFAFRVKSLLHRAKLPVTRPISTTWRFRDERAELRGRHRSRASAPCPIARDPVRRQVAEEQPSRERAGTHVLRKAERHSRRDLRLERPAAGPSFALSDGALPCDARRPVRNCKYVSPVAWFDWMSTLSPPSSFTGWPKLSASTAILSTSFSWMFASWGVDLCAALDEPTQRGSWGRRRWCCHRGRRPPRAMTPDVKIRPVAAVLHHELDPHLTCERESPSAGCDRSRFESRTSR